MTYTLQVKETGNKAGKYSYTVVDENGSVISTRKSNREYVACTIDGCYYFGRLDLIGKGDHGKNLKYFDGWRWNKEKNKMMPAQAEPLPHPAIAYK